jgi:hypothetical protein
MTIYYTFSSERSHYEMTNLRVAVRSYLGVLHELIFDSSDPPSSTLTDLEGRATQKVSAASERSTVHIRQ